MGDRAVSLRQAAYATAGFAALVVVGTIGFMAILGENVLDAAYRTIITVYTAGLVSAPESAGAKLITILLVVWGVGIFLYVFGLVIELTVSGAVTGALQQRRARRRVERFSDHYIICGFGRVGRSAANEFRESGATYVVLDDTPDAREAAQERGDLFVHGKGTDDDDLAAAGIARAAGLVASGDSDAENIYITLSAKSARPDLLVVARASDADAAAKLRLAGADRVVQPYSTAGREMANLVLKPQVAAFLNIVASAGGPRLAFEEIEITDGSGHVGKSLRDLRLREATGAMVVALRKRDGTYDTAPAPDAVFQAGDVMIAVGTPEELRALEEMFAPKQAVAG